MIPISEIFPSIQGEGIDVGLPTLFVRVAGCNLVEQGKGCSYCDTKYAWSLKKSKLYEVVDLAEEITVQMDKYHLYDVSITGGEPLGYSDIPTLVRLLKYNISIQTNGTILLPDIDVYWSMDVKCPSAGNNDLLCRDNFNKLTFGDQVKFVIGTREDYEYAKSIIDTHLGRIDNIIFQPSWKVLPLKTLAQWILEDQKLSRNVRLGVQMHKVIWPGRKRGV